jgi:hypothetical protein
MLISDTERANAYAERLEVLLELVYSSDLGPFSLLSALRRCSWPTCL